MPTLNGIGTKFHDFRFNAAEDEITVTNWIVFLYFPIVPIGSSQLKLLVDSGGFLTYETLRAMPIDWKGVLKTYLFGWILVPILWFWPIPFAVREVGEYLGYTNEKAEGGLYYTIIAFALLWIIVFAWKWKDWDENRWIPSWYPSSQTDVKSK